MSENEVYGRTPYKYAYVKTGWHRQPAVMIHYRLVTGDSFEIGSAYSLHKNLRDAKKYWTQHWWQKDSEPEKVFVTKRTIEDILKDEEKAVFESWEN
ncbi:MAG: hypothetical protein KKF46_02715 [Nanoarchaeota archaeon]|nr:hypothetical protein [Nanoarchaeota archaeon]MBU1321244.1 hypothetical protein [Nanoarchaeota archaeon]MBU1596998.1 hypothetical protein [Nanoarchaeota archaeon]MBU2441577.1 hypothetical protein [Nanoarchaeota archaeon]